MKLLVFAFIAASTISESSAATLPFGYEADSYWQDKLGEPKTQAYVTVARHNEEALTAVVLGESLKRSGTKRMLVVLITDSVDVRLQIVLGRVFDRLINVSHPLDQKFQNALNSAPASSETFAKLYIYNLTEFTKCVFIDAGSIVVKNADQLFSYKDLSAAPEFGWPDYFNTLVLVIEPKQETFHRLLDFVLINHSFDGTDQGVLNQFHSDWKSENGHRFPLLFNCRVDAGFNYPPAYDLIKDSIAIVTFPDHQKPWRCNLDIQNQADPRSRFVQLWWDVLRNDAKKDFVDVNANEINGIPMCVMSEIV